MRCPYCGQDNPDGAVFCACGRPISLSGGYGNQMNQQMNPQMNPQMTPFPMQTLDQVKHKKAFNFTPIIVVLALLLGAGIFFGLQWYKKKSMTDESMWKTITGDGYSITAPKVMKKGKMVTVSDSEATLLDFYTSDEAGFDVSIYHYTDAEQKVLSKMTANDYLETITLGGKRTTKINDQEVKYSVRKDKYIISNGLKVHRPNYVKKSDEVYYIKALFPCKDCYYQVNVYCAESEKSKYEDILIKWLDSFEAV